MKVSHKIAKSVANSFILFWMICAGDVLAEPRPNVLFLAVDDMNDFVGCLDSRPNAITPNIDRLAARGVCFTNAHTAGVFCAPRLPHQFVRELGDPTPVGRGSLGVYHADTLRRRELCRCGQTALPLLP